MILELSLQHVNEKKRHTKIQLWGLDANKVAQIRQDFNKATLQSYIHDFIEAKLPLHYYNFEVVDYEFKSHLDHNFHPSDPGDTPIIRELRREFSHLAST